MRQTRLSIGCRDWQAIIETIGPEAAGILLYLLSMMRSMQVAAVSIRISELAAALHLSDETAETALASIQASGYLTQIVDASGVITLRSDEEKKRQNEVRRKRAARLLSRFQGQSTGQSGDTFFDKNGQSAGQSGRSQTCTEEVRFAPRADGPSGQSGVLTATSEDLSVKQYTTDFFMIYSGPSEKAEKEPHTPQKEESLTEIQTHTRSNKTCEQPELPADSMEAEYIDICGVWPPSLRNAIRAEKDDIREAFYLFVRTRQTETGKAWTADQVRIAWLAARRIPEERRADSILAAAMANWKTIRDVGSGMYFEKETGRIVSLVRGPVGARGMPADQPNSDLAKRLARNMRRD